MRRPKSAAALTRTVRVSAFCKAANDKVRHGVRSTSGSTNARVCVRHVASCARISKPSSARRDGVLGVARAWVACYGIDPEQGSDHVC